MFSEFETTGVDPAETPSPAAAVAASAPDEQTEASAVSAKLTEPEPAAPATETVTAPDHATGSNGAASDAQENAAAAASGDEDLPSSEELSKLMDQYAAPAQAPTEGEILEGRVIAISDLGVVVDIGRKSEGLIPASEFLDAENPAKLEPGLTIEVQPTGEHKDGYVILSYQRAHRRRVWANIEKAYREKTHVTGRIVDRVKGGLVVDIGVRAFLPASQADSRPVNDLEELKNQDIEVRIIKMNRKRGNIVVSRRAILDEENQAQREKLKETLHEGQVLRGTIKSITSYGVFVDLGGVDGLLHVSDLSWGRVANPVDVVRPGEELEVIVLKFDREKMRVSLGRRQLLPDPWASVAERFPSGTRVQGKIVGVADYGVFVEMEPGVEGLVHVSEMSWSKRKQHPSKLVQVGDPAEVVVLEVKPEQRRISLGLKQAQADPWAELAQKYPVGSRVTGKVRNLTEFGAFIEIEEGFDGLIHVSDIQLDAAREKRRRHAQEGRHGGSQSAEDRRGQPPRVAGDQATERHLGQLVHLAQDQRRSAWKGVPPDHLWCVRRAGGWCRGALPHLRNRGTAQPRLTGEAGASFGAGARAGIRLQDREDSTRSAQDRFELHRRGGASGGAARDG